MSVMYYKRTEDDIKFLRDMDEGGYRRAAQLCENPDLESVVLSGIPQYIADIVTNDDSTLEAYPYAGRGSYGSKWLAVNLDDSAMSEAQFGAALVHAALSRWNDYSNVYVDDMVIIAFILSEFLRGTRSDSMGRSAIVIYWPQATCLEAE